jgi:adenylate kinase family enzyme
VVAAEADLTGLLQARRILVLGSPGAGKTLLSTFLSWHLGLELVRLDDFFWKPGPVRLPTDEWRMLVVKLASRPSWVMDGTYEASLDLRIPAADAIVYIQSSRWVCLWRVVTRRLLSRWRRHEESTHGHALTSFFVRYVFRFPISTQPEVFRLIAQQGRGKPLIVLGGANGVELLIRRLEDGSTQAGSPKDGVSAEGRLADLQRNRHA